MKNISTLIIKHREIIFRFFKAFILCNAILLLIIGVHDDFPLMVYLGFFIYISYEFLIAYKFKEGVV